MNLIKKVENLLNGDLKEDFKKDVLINHARSISDKEQQAVLNQYFSKILYSKRMKNQN